MTSPPALRIAAATAAMVALAVPAAQARPAMDPPGAVPHHERTPVTHVDSGSDWSSAGIGGDLVLATIAGALCAVRPRRSPVLR